MVHKSNNNTLSYHYTSKTNYSFPFTQFSLIFKAGIVWRLDVWLLGNTCINGTSR